MATTQIDPARFEVVAAITKAAGTPGKPTIEAIASSDSIDLGHDRFLLSALQQMAQNFPGMTAFRNHQYSVPEDVVGVVASARVVARDGGNDLDVVINVDTTNPAALAVLEQVKSGVRLGVSIGVIVNAARATTEEIDGRKVKILNIEDVTCLELSVVGLPSNRRSWVTAATKSAAWVARDALAGSDDDTMDATELTAVKAVVRLLMAGLKESQAAVTERDQIIAEMLPALNWFMDQPVGRRCDPALVSSLENMGDKFPHLDGRIIAHLAKSKA